MSQCNRFVAWTKAEPYIGGGHVETPTMQVQQLAELSEFLNYNFFREIAVKLPYPEPDYSIAEDRSEAKHLQNRIKELELEVSIFRQTLKDLVSR